MIITIKQSTFSELAILPEFDRSAGRGTGIKLRNICGNIVQIEEILHNSILWRKLHLVQCRYYFQTTEGHEDYFFKLHLAGLLDQTNRHYQNQFCVRCVCVCGCVCVFWFCLFVCLFVCLFFFCLISDENKQNGAGKLFPVWCFGDSLAPPPPKQIYRHNCGCGTSNFGSTWISIQVFFFRAVSF